MIDPDEPPMDGIEAVTYTLDTRTASPRKQPSWDPLQPLPPWAGPVAAPVPTGLLEHRQSGNETVQLLPAWTDN